MPAKSKRHTRKRAPLERPITEDDKYASVSIEAFWRLEGRRIFVSVSDTYDRSLAIAAVDDVKEAHDRSIWIPHCGFLV
jgi:hypothetical protein